MPARGDVPAFNELEAGNTGFGLRPELAAVEQFAFERGEEALAHGVVVAIADRAHRRPDTHFLAPEAEGHGRVLRSLVAMMDDAIWFALLTCHGIFPPFGIRVRPNEGTDNEANEIHGRADHRHFDRA